MTCCGNLIISGSRSITDKQEVINEIIESPLYAEEDTILVGDAKGVDEIVRNNFDDVKVYEAEWGRYGDAAGPMRNKEMVEDGDKLIAVWDGESTGTASAINQAKDQNLPVDIRHFNEGSVFEY